VQGFIGIVALQGISRLKGHHKLQRHTVAGLLTVLRNLTSKALVSSAKWIQMQIPYKASFTGVIPEGEECKVEGFLDELPPAFLAKLTPPPFHMRAIKAD